MPVVVDNYFVTHDQVIAEWEKDCIIDRAKIPEISLGHDQLVFKYQKFSRWARREASHLQSDLKKLRLDKLEFYTKGPSEATRGRGWRSAPQGKLTKDDARNYVEADSDVCGAIERLDEAENLVRFIDSILETLRNRSFRIKNAIETEKFFAGLDK
jgi:hypothetical protein